MRKIRNKIKILFLILAVVVSSSQVYGQTKKPFTRLRHEPEAFFDNAIAPRYEGTTVYNTDRNKPMYSDGIVWTEGTTSAVAEPEIVVIANDLRTTYPIGAGISSKQAALDQAMAAAEAVVSGNVYVQFPHGLETSGDGYNFTTGKTVEIDASNALIKNRNANNDYIFRFENPKSGIQNLRFLNSGTSGNRRGIVFAIGANDNYAKNISSTDCNGPPIDNAAKDCLIDGLYLRNQEASLRFIFEGTGTIQNFNVGDFNVDHAFAHNGTVPGGYIFFQNGVIHHTDSHFAPGLLNCNWLNGLGNIRMKKLIVRNVVVDRPAPTNPDRRTMFKLSACEEVLFENITMTVGPNVLPTPQDLDAIIISPDISFITGSSPVIDQMTVRNCFFQGFFRGLPNGGDNPIITSLTLEDTTFDFSSVLANNIAMNNLNSDNFIMRNCQMINANRPVNSWIFFWECFFNKAVLEGNTFHVIASTNTRVFATADSKSNKDLDSLSQRDNKLVNASWSDNTVAAELISRKVPGTFNKYKIDSTVLPPPTAPFTLTTRAIGVSANPSVIDDKRWNGGAWVNRSVGGGGGGTQGIDSVLSQGENLSTDRSINLNGNNLTFDANGGSIVNQGINNYTVASSGNINLQTLGSIILGDGAGNFVPPIDADSDAVVLGYDPQTGVLERATTTAGNPGIEDVLSQNQPFALNHNINLNNFNLTFSGNGGDFTVAGGTADIVLAASNTFQLTSLTGVYQLGDGAGNLVPPADSDSDIVFLGLDPDTGRLETGTPSGGGGGSSFPVELRGNGAPSVANTINSYSTTSAIGSAPTPIANARYAVVAQNTGSRLDYVSNAAGNGWIQTGAISTAPESVIHKASGISSDIDKINVYASQGDIGAPPSVAANSSYSTLAADTGVINTYISNSGASAWIQVVGDSISIEVYTSIANLPDPTTVVVGSMAIVVNDPTATNNGAYFAVGSNPGNFATTWQQ